MAKTPVARTERHDLPAPFSRPLIVAMLKRSGPTKFDIQPDEAELRDIIEQLKLSDLRDFRFKGMLIPTSKQSWTIEARLTGTPSQACVISLTPVPQKVDETIVRRFEPDEGRDQSTEIDLDLSVEDDTDFYDDKIDLGEVAVESLALALEPYPRKPGVALETRIFAEPGTEPLTDEAIKPFAALAELKKKLSSDES